MRLLKLIQQTQKIKSPRNNTIEDLIQSNIISGFDKPIRLKINNLKEGKILRKQLVDFYEDKRMYVQTELNSNFEMISFSSKAKEPLLYNNMS